MTEASDSDSPPLEANAYVVEMQAPETPPNLVILAGYLGEVEETGRWRLYTTLELDTYLEFSATDVFRHELTPVGPVEGTVLWLFADTNLTFVHGDLEQALATKVLSGDVMDNLGRFPPRVCPRSNH